MTEDNFRFNDALAPVTIANVEPKHLLISNLVSINLKDGTVTFMENYDPDLAARAFWTALSDDYRKMLKWKAEHSNVVQVARDYDV